jgi:hypothetical protein
MAPEIAKKPVNRPAFPDFPLSRKHVLRCVNIRFPATVETGWCGSLMSSDEAGKQSWHRLNTRDM